MRPHPHRELTLMLALASAFVLSLTFVPALAALTIRGHVAETEVPLIVRAKRWYEPRLRHVLARPYPAIAAALASGAVAASPAAAPGPPK